MNEFDYIEKYFKPLADVVGDDLKNDAAVFNQRLLVLILWQKVFIFLGTKTQLK